MDKDFLKTQIYRKNECLKFLTEHTFCIPCELSVEFETLLNYYTMITDDVTKIELNLINIEPLYHYYAVAYYSILRSPASHI